MYKLTIKASYKYFTTNEENRNKSENDECVENLSFENLLSHCDVLTCGVKNLSTDKR